MTDAIESQEPVDGRSARRERNRNAVLDVVLEMFSEDMLFPTIEQASKRSGLSLRSLYRYFADPGELVEAAIKRSRQQATELTHLPRIGQGPFADRLHDFVSMRVRLYEVNGPMYRATVHNAASNSRVRDEMHRNRSLLHAQFEAQFAPEIAARPAGLRTSVTEAGNTLTQLDSLDLLRRYRNLTVAETTTVLCDALTALLHPDAGTGGADPST
jgi:AcrR family transcriptional regulator